MSRVHYENCLADGWQECNCYEFDKALEWVTPYLLNKVAEEIEADVPPPLIGLKGSMAMFQYRDYLANIARYYK